MHTIRQRGTVWSSLAAFCSLLSVAAAPQALSAADQLVPLDLRQVRIGGEIGRRIDVTVQNNLLVLDIEKDFLSPFRTRKAQDGYVGLGKLIDATVRLAAYTQDAKVIALKNHLIEETIRTQESDGYIGTMAPPARMWKLWDIHEMGYIAFGLLSDHHWFGEERSLEAARRLTDYIIERWQTMPADWAAQSRISAHVAVIGLERTLLAIYRATNHPRYLEFCTTQRTLVDWNPGIVTGRREPLDGHIYGYLVRCLAQLELYRLRPKHDLLRPTQRAVRFLTAEDGLTITGAAGQWEIWTDDQDGRTSLGETCATAYQLRVYDSLLRLQGDPYFADLIERTVYNTLFAAQSPDGRRIRYYTPLEGARQYFSLDTYCCPGNYRRIVAELPSMVYYRRDKGLAVSLYTESAATMDLDDHIRLRVRQETDYPTSGRVTVHLDPSQPATFALSLRIPRWCQAAAVAVNGKPWETPAVLGQFLSIERPWNAGDRVTLDLPMPWRLVLGRKRQSGRAAVMRGPVVFCLNPEQNRSLGNRDAADLGGILLDPTSIQDSPGNQGARPGGVACSVRAGDDGNVLGVSGNLSLVLTEFPDPQGKCVYFRLPDLSIAVPDELSVGDIFAQSTK